MAVKKKPLPRKKKIESFSEGVGLAARSARKTARMHGTLLYFWENGRVVAPKP